MRDLTQGSITQQIMRMGAPIAAGMIVQLLYQMIDLYFVSGLGDVAIAGVSAANNAALIVFALTQVLGVGTVAVISHAAGRKDQKDANLAFNQALTLSGLCGAVVLVVGYLLTRVYLRLVSADAATVDAGAKYLYCLWPGLALQFALIAMGSALRGTGIVKPTMLVQTVTVVINATLAPVLIAGWGTGRPLGVAGAGLATSIAVTFGVAMLWIYFHRLEHYVAVNRNLLRPRWDQCKRMLQIGLPSGGEFALIFITTGLSYYAIRNFGSAAQAGYGIGSRILQAITLPAMAVSFAAGPIAGQNFGAKIPERVRETFRQAAIISSVAMVVETIIAQWAPGVLVGLFTREPQTLAVGVLFLRIMSLNFVAQGLIYTCSSMFQGLGNTRPSLFSSSTRLVTYALPVLWLSGTPGFKIQYVWYLSIATQTFQMMVSLLLLRRELRRRLNFAPRSRPQGPADVSEAGTS
jgi:putative MATE family efflux protein